MRLHKKFGEKVSKEVEVFEVDDNDDPIESFPEPKQAIKPASVRERVAKFEEKSGQSDSKRLPMINLKAQLGMQNGGVKNSMKPRSGLQVRTKRRPFCTLPLEVTRISKPQPRRQLDEASVSSGFRTSSPAKKTPALKKSQQAQDSFVLPIDEWSFGTELFERGAEQDPKFWFCYDGRKLSVKYSPERNPAYKEFSLQEVASDVLVSLIFVPNFATTALTRMYSARGLHPLGQVMLSSN